mgnify:CR=1 FL=1
MENGRKAKWLAISTLAGLLGMAFTGAAVAESDRALGSCDGIRLGSLLSKWRPSTLNDSMQSWIGANLPEVVAKWGAPAATFENRDGTRIVSWKEGDSLFGECTKTFEADAQDVLTRWNTSGACECTYRNSRELRSTPVPRMTL